MHRQIMRSKSGRHLLVHANDPASAISVPHFGQVPILGKSLACQILDVT